MKWLAIAAALAGCCACVPSDGPLMEPGENCQGCHGNTGTLYLGERRRHAKTWTVAGTVFDPAHTATGFEGAQVHIIDANGFDFRIRTNLAGNFYTRETVQLPLQACIERDGNTICQQSPVTSGACNACHNQTALNAPEPPLVAP
jgi:hypothetical protein